MILDFDNDYDPKSDLETGAFLIVAAIGSVFAIACIVGALIYWMVT